MRRPATPFNPGRFTDALDESFHRRGWGSGRAQKRKRHKVIGWLRRKWTEDDECMALAERLEKCKPGSRCRSGACPECATAAQHLFTKIVAKFLKGHAAHEDIVCVSIVPADGVSNPGHLSRTQHARNVRRWKEAMGRAGIEWFIGAVDFSLNEHAQQRYAAHWSEHIYGFTTRK
jgi:hypothetical protein